jgi:hypothetical protein
LEKTLRVIIALKKTLRVIIALKKTSHVIIALKKMSRVILKKKTAGVILKGKNNECNQLKKWRVFTVMALLGHRRGPYEQMSKCS